MATLPRDAEGYVKTFDAYKGTIQLLEFLDHYGVVVVRNVIDASDINHTIDAIWNHDELTSRGVKRDVLATWGRCWPQDGKIERKGWIESGDTMLCPASWRNRLHPTVSKVFHDVWAHKGETDLRVSFDRYGVMRPLIDPAWRTDEGWLHTDQNPKREPDFARFQGILALTDSTTNTGGFICVPGFHREEYKAYCAQHPIDEDVCMLPDDLSHELIESGRAEKICVRPGSLIIWDSRLPHANYPNDSRTNWRMVQYITYYPASSESSKRARIRKETVHGLRAKMEEQYGCKLFSDQQFRLMGGT